MRGDTDAPQPNIAMSSELPQRTQASRHGGHITIVASTYNEKYTTALLDNCLAELEENAPQTVVDVVRVPGAFEVPIMVKRSIVEPAGADKPDVVIALGVILRGSTAHADLIGDAITRQLLSIACDSLTPVIHEVLLLNDEQQAFARCIASALNRGREAARAAISMINLLDERYTLHSLKQRMSGINRNGSLI